MNGKLIVAIRYVNHRGEEAVRRIVPLKLWYGSEKPWHPEPQWLLDAYDLDKDASRTFAMEGVSEWGEPEVEVEK